jgi:hypothetical protein
MLMHGALGLVQEQGSMRERARTLMSMGILEMEGDPRAGLAHALDAVDAARRAGARGLEVMGMSNALECAVDVGEWATADGLAEDLLARGDLPGFLRGGVAMGVALLAANRGDADAARTALETIEASLMSSSDVPGARTWFHRTQATTRLLAGELDGAFEAGMTAIREDPTGENTGTASWSSARAALWLRDPEKVRAALAAMGTLRGRWPDAARGTVQAGLAALEGRIDDAAAGYVRCLQAWSALELPLDRAVTVIDAASLLPPELLPPGEVERTNAYLRELGARPLLERLEAAVAMDATAER